MQIEYEMKETELYYIRDIKVGECFIRTESGGLYLRTDLYSYEDDGKRVDGAVKLENGKVEYFPDNEPVTPVTARVIAEEV